MTKLSRVSTDRFDKSNLWNMRAFFLCFPKIDALRRDLSWTHYRLLLRVEKSEARAFYEAKERRMLDMDARLSEKEMKK